MKKKKMEAAEESNGQRARQLRPCTASSAASIEAPSPSPSRGRRSSAEAAEWKNAQSLLVGSAGRSSWKEDAAGGAALHSHSHSLLG
ncbi:hypothetical protein SORBI_3009G029001 [Sorghum bicolor]|uniref:Uncharacterized protein n=1 Tax=Sorghum bicolor TaxID=4558 RepID=A0A1Z5R0M3_SORBI|nr:hypothetical protein SORBI_3009G029001 [Sorghum bicolor]